MPASGTRTRTAAASAIGLIVLAELVAAVAARRSAGCDCATPDESCTCS
jgi:hypothetical protein